MFDIGWSELLIIGVVALIAIGPKELPGVLRAVGQWSAKIRRMASEFQGQFQEALREAEMADLKKQVDELGDTARAMTPQFDPADYDPSRWEPKPAPPLDTAPSGEPEAAPAVPPAEPAVAAGGAPPEPAPGDKVESPPSAPTPGSGA